MEFTVTSELIEYSSHFSTSLFFDADSDEHLDLFFAGDHDFDDNPIAPLLLNDGSGNFTQTSTGIGTGFRYADIAVGDLNGDEYDDFIINGKVSSFSTHDRAYPNDGEGNFSWKIQTILNVFGGFSRLADVDSDNDLDLFITGVTEDITNRSPRKASGLFLNDGTGTFTRSNTVRFESVYYVSGEFIDVDWDGDLGLAYSGQAADDNL